MFIPKAVAAISVLILGGDQEREKF